MNIFSGIGRLGRDAEVRHTSAGKPVTTFAVAIEDGVGLNAMFGGTGQRRWP